MNIGEEQEVHEIQPQRIEKPSETDVIPDDLEPAETEPQRDTEPVEEPDEAEPVPA